jgi:hypothetical protein
MKSLVIFLGFLLICNITVAQKTNSGVKKGDQVGATTHITPNSSGVKRSIGYRFSKDQSDTDPGNGTFRYNNENPAGITYIFLDNVDISGEDQTKWYSTWDDTTGATARGQLFIVDDKGGNKSILNVSGVFVRENGYWKIPVEFVSGNMPVDGSIYYYVFNRIAKKQKEVKPDQVITVTQTNKDTVGKKETIALAATGVVLVSQVNNATGVVQENQVTQEKKENQENQVTQEKKENQENKVTQEKKENQGNEMAQVSEGNKKKKEADWDEVPQGNQQKQVTSTNMGKQGTQNNQITRTDVGKKETKVIASSEIIAASQANNATQGIQSNKTNPGNQETKVNQTAQNKPVTQTTTVNQSVQNNITTQVKQETKVNQTPQNKPVNQPLTANQGLQNTNTTQVKQETKVNQTSQNKPVTQTTTTNQAVQNNNTDKVQQTTRVTTSTQTITSNQTSTVSQTNQYSVNQNSTSTQSTRHRKCYRGIIEIGYDLGLGNYGINNFKFNFINGFKIGPYASVGLGIGYRRYYYKNENHTDKFLVSEVNQIPVFLDLRSSFSGKKLTPYLAVGIGGSTGSGSSETKQEGLYFTTSGGIWYNISERLAIFAGIAYDLQRLEFSDANPFTNNYNKYSNSLGINIGISF